MGECIWLSYTNNHMDLSGMNKWVFILVLVKLNTMLHQEPHVLQEDNFFTLI